MTAATLPTREPTRTAAPRTTRTARTGSAIRQEVLDHPNRPASCTSHQPAASRPQYDVQVSFEGWDDGGYTSAGAPIGPVVREWSGAEAHALQQAMRLTNMGFAEKLGFGLRTVAGWRSDTTAKLRTSTQDILDAALRQASPEERQRFLQVTRPDLGRDPLTPAPLTTPATTPATTPPTTSAAASRDAAPVETSDDSTTAYTDPENSACRCDSCRAYLADENLSSRPAACDETAPSQDAAERARAAVEQLRATAAAARQRAAQAARQAIEDERSRYHQSTDETSTSNTNEKVLEAA